jgi:hypothetical protein
MGMFDQEKLGLDHDEAAQGVARQAITPQINAHPYNLGPSTPIEAAPQPRPVVSTQPQAYGKMLSPEAIAATTPPTVPGPISTNRYGEVPHALAPTPDLAAPAGFAPSAYDRGQSIRSGIGQARDAITTPIVDRMEAARPVAEGYNNFFRGVFGASPISSAEAAPPPQRPAIAPSAQQVRGPVADYPDQNSRAAGTGGTSALGQQAANNATQSVPVVPKAGPISTAVGGYTPPAAGAAPTVQDYQARLGQQELRDGLRTATDTAQIQERNRGQIAQGNAAEARLRAERLDREAAVDKFRATNGADMVLAASNPAYGGQRNAIPPERGHFARQCHRRTARGEHRRRRDRQAPDQPGR